MSELTELLKDMRLALDGMGQGCAVDEMPRQCRHAMKHIAFKMARADKLAEELERHYKLIDDLYYSVGSKLNSTWDLNELLGIILDSLKKLIGYDAAGIFLVNHKKGKIEAEFIVGYNPKRLNVVHQKIGEGILGWVIENVQPANIPDVRIDSRYIDARKQTRSELAVPMISEGQVIGCINLESNRRDAFAQEDMNLLETYATQATLAVQRARMQRQLYQKKRLEEELLLARNIQLSLLPQNPPDIPGYDIAGMNVPSLEVGGDYYDYIPIPSGGTGFAIADVSGKGVAASLIMSGFRAAIRSEIRHNFQPHMIMHKVNHFVEESVSEGRFVTAFYGALKGDEFQYVNAGHNPPILMHEDGGYELLEKGGLVLGIQTEQYYEQGFVKLKAGDCILFYTDGVTEAMNEREEEFGLKRLLKVLQGTAGLPVYERIKRLHRKVTRFSHQLKLMDDLTIMLIQKD